MTDTLEPIGGVAVGGNYVYSIIQGRGQVFDISDPGQMRQVSSFEANRLALEADYAYVGYYNHLHIVDVSDPLDPTRVGSTDYGRFNSSAEDLAMYGNHAYIVDGYNLYVIDVTIPTEPSQVGSLEVWNAYRVDAAGSYVYVANSGSSFHVIDASDPTQPSEVGMIYLPGAMYTEDVTAAGGYVYVATAWHGLYVVDVSDPAHPIVADSYHMPGTAVDLATARGYIYAACKGGGLTVLKFKMHLLFLPTVARFYSLYAGEQE